MTQLQYKSNYFQGLTAKTTSFNQAHLTKRDHLHQIDQNKIENMGSS